MREDEEDEERVKKKKGNIHKRHIKSWLYVAIIITKTYKGMLDKVKEIISRMQPVEGARSSPLYVY